MSQKLFVGGLPWSLSEDELRQAFEPFGEVAEAKIIYDRDTGRSRGFGFVTMGDEKGGREAREALDGSYLGGRTIRVDQASDQRQRGGGGGGGGGGRY